MKILILLLSSLSVFGSLNFAGALTYNVNHGSGVTLDDLPGAGTMTAWAWVYRTSNGANQVICRKGSGWLFQIDNGPGEGAIRLIVFRTVATDFISTSAAVPLNTWTFVAATYEDAASPKVKLYSGTQTVAAALLGTTTATAGSGTYTADAAANLYVSDPTTAIIGQIRRGGVSSAALTLAQIRYLQFSTLAEAAAMTGTKLCWEYVSSTNYATDQSGNGNTGTLTGATTGSSDPTLAAAVLVTDTNIYFSPYNWYSDGGGALLSNNVNTSSTYARSSNPGSYVKGTITVPTGGSGIIVFAFDVTDYATLTASKCPTIYYQVNGGAFSSQLLSTDTSRVVVGSGLAAGNHTFAIYFKSITLSTPGDRWTTPLQSIWTRGLYLDTGGTTTAQTLRSKKAIFFGDSNFEGAAHLSNGTANTDNDATSSAIEIVARGLDAEYGAVAFGGQGYVRGLDNVAASATNPAVYSATAANNGWDKYSNGKSRLVSTLFSPVPDYIFVEHGGNDTGLTATPVTALLEALRTAAGASAWIFCITNPVGQNAVAGNQTAISDGIAAVANQSRTKPIVLAALYTTVASLYSNDSGSGGAHANIRGAGHQGARMLSLAKGYIAAGRCSVVVE